MMSETIRVNPAELVAAMVNVPSGTPTNAKRPLLSLNTPRPSSRESGSGKRFTATPASGVTPSGANTVPATEPRPRNRSATGTSVCSRALPGSTTSRNRARSTPSAAAMASRAAAVEKPSASRTPADAPASSRKRAEETPSAVAASPSSCAAPAESPAVSVAETL